MSVIGQPEERAATIAALAGRCRSSGHELGRALRLKRIPDLHVQLDDTAERGTRVMHLLGELETARPRHEDLPLGETLPTPVPRVHHEGDTGDEPPSR